MERKNIICDVTTIFECFKAAYRSGKLSNVQTLIWRKLIKPPLGIWLVYQQRNIREIFNFFHLCVIFNHVQTITYLSMLQHFCKLLKNYHYEGGHSETITDFLLASTKKFLLCFTYCAFMALKHSTVFSI